MTELINEKLFYVLQNLNQPPAPVSLSAYFCSSVNKEAICQCFVNLLLSLTFPCSAVEGRAVCISAGSNVFLDHVLCNQCVEKCKTTTFRTQDGNFWHHNHFFPSLSTWFVPWRCGNRYEEINSVMQLPIWLRTFRTPWKCKSQCIIYITGVFLLFLFSII